MVIGHFRARTERYDLMGSLQQDYVLPPRILGATTYRLSTLQQEK